MTDRRTAPDSAVIGHLLAAFAWLIEQGRVDGVAVEEALRATATEGDLTGDTDWDAWHRQQALRADQRARAVVLDATGAEGVLWVGGPLASPEGDTTRPT